MWLIRMAWLSFALAAAAAPTTQAQNDPSGGARLHGKKAMLLKDIDLDATQKAKIDSVMADYRAKLKAFRQSEGSRDNSGREKVRELMAQQLSDVRAFLTSDQQKVFDKNAAAMRTSRGRQRPPSSQP